MDDNKTETEPMEHEHQTSGTCTHTALPNEIQYKSLDDLQDWGSSGV